MSDWANSVSQRAWSRPIILTHDGQIQKTQHLFDPMETGEEEDVDCWGKMAKQGVGRWKQYFKLKSS
jgi:hypothetical protein